MTPQVMAELRTAAQDSPLPQLAVIDAKEPVMSNPIHLAAFLRRVLLADAVVSVAVGAAMALGAGALEGLLGLPPALLTVAGLALFPYAAYLGWLTTRDTVPRAAVWLPIVLNVAWAIKCGLVAFGSGSSPTALGLGFIAIQVLTVLLFAELEYTGLRRACAIVAA
jgi:hypothetical protein